GVLQVGNALEYRLVGNATAPDGLALALPVPTEAKPVSCASAHECAQIGCAVVEVKIREQAVVFLTDVLVDPHDEAADFDGDLGDLEIMRGERHGVNEPPSGPDLRELEALLDALVEDVDRLTLVLLLHEHVVDVLRDHRAKPVEERLPLFVHDD